MPGRYGRGVGVNAITLGGPKVRPVARVEIEVGQGVGLGFLVLATDDGNIWDPGKGSTNDLGRNDLWSLAKAEIYVLRYAGQHTLDLWGCAL